MNEGYRAWGALKSVLSYRGLGIKSKKCLYEGVIVPTALYGAEAWAMRSAERRKVNVLEMKCLRSLVGVSIMDRVRNEEVRRRAGIERELASIVIIIKKDWQCNAGRGRLTPYQSEDPSPTLPTYRGEEEKQKIVEDKKGESN